MWTRQFVSAGLLPAFFVVATPARAENKVELVQTSDNIPEANLLDVDVLAFEPGLSDERALRKLRKAGISPEVRKAEALYIPIHLARTLQKTGFWGAVRVGPAASIDDLTISGAISSSTGAELEVDIRVIDSRGMVWLDKQYKSKADASVYNVRHIADDPFQELYNRIANDLIARRRKIDQKDVTRIREITLLRFAADLAPAPFTNYLVSARDRYSVARLPAQGDPMMARIERLRLRDRMLIDTLDSYYANFYSQMQEAYGSWRSQDYWRREAMKRSSARRSYRGGSGAMGNGAGSSLVPFPTDGNTPGVGVGPECGTSQLFPGGGAANSWERQEESKRIDHLAVLRELGASLASDMAPLLIEVEGKVLRLTGSADTVYARWRELLRELFATETGLPVVAAGPTN
ncbi:MAG TPA: hypothetical protein VEK15_17795 [Vicinamibacteria bacterium]|nr:hypothetical protein [Vicinamibacteria bacterium]